jgi:hypothetical protein
LTAYSLWNDIDGDQGGSSCDVIFGFISSTNWIEFARKEILFWQAIHGQMSIPSKTAAVKCICRSLYNVQKLIKEYIEIAFQM